MILPVTILFALATMFNAPAASPTSPAAVESTGTTMTWEPDIITIHRARTGGAWYPRLLQLDARTLLCSFDTNEDGGRTIVKVARSRDGGRTWEPPAVAASDPHGGCANGQLFRAPGQAIWLAYRVVIRSPGRCSTALRIRQSRDGGVSWTDLPGGEIASEIAPGFHGVWEPHLGLIGRRIAVMYADDGPSVGGGPAGQDILLRFRERNGWSSPVVVSDGVARRSRDGMPVWTRLADGRILVVYEASDSPGHPFVIRAGISPDGRDWSQPGTLVFAAMVPGKRAAAPFVARLGDGRLLVTFQSDEEADGVGEAFCSIRAVIGDPAASRWSGPINVFRAAEGGHFYWGALLPLGKRRIAAVAAGSRPAPGIYLRLGTATRLGLKSQNELSYTG